MRPILGFPVVSHLRQSPTRSTLPHMPQRFVPPSASNSTSSSSAIAETDLRSGATQPAIRGSAVSQPWW